jgi:hypothetical protein
MVKRIGLVLGVVVALVALLLVGAEIWGRRWLARYAETWRAEIAAERQRVASLRMPVLHGAPLDENAAVRYRPLLEKLKAATDGNRELYVTALGKSVTGGRATVPPAEVAALLEAHRGEIASLGDAVRCTRCDWNIQYEDGFGAELPPLLAARVLANLVILEGHERGRAGDAEGAAKRYLDVARFGADFGTGSLLEVLIGTAVDDLALEALGKLLTAAEPSRFSVAAIDAALSKLEGHLPSIAHGMKMERLTLGSLSVPRPPAADEPALAGGVLEWVTPKRALYAHALSRLDPVLRAMERALSTEDPDERARILAEVKDPTPSWNPILNMTVPSLTRSRVAGLDLTARYRLVRLALAVEQAAVAGRYPADGGGIDLPVDPHAAPALLRYQATADGRGYKLWSVGSDGKDDGGKAEGQADLVVERRPAP